MFLYPIKPFVISKMVVLSILVAFFVTMAGPIGCMAGAEDFNLPVPGVMVRLSPPLDPPILKGIKVHPDNPFRFDFILDKGDFYSSSPNASVGDLQQEQLKTESTKLIKYFLASITIPEKDLWVNLSPYEKDRIIPQFFGLTEMGRDLLAEDYMLKQITASLIYPEDKVGKKFWQRIYQEAAKRFGNTHVPVSTFNKVWILPEKAVVYENAQVGAAYIVESKLKVMLDQDYLSLAHHEGSSAAVHAKDINQLGSQVVREIVIPQLTREVNEDKNFSRLRQVYNSLILAAWYKKKIRNSLLSQVYADQNKTAGVNIDDPQEKERIYQRYLRAFKKGVYNYIKEEQDPLTQETIPRKYFSGGYDFSQLSHPTDLNIKPALEISSNEAMISAGESNSQGRTMAVDAGVAIASAPTPNSDRFTGTTSVHNFLDTLASDDAARLKDAYFSRNTNYIEQQERYQLQIKHLMSMIQDEIQRNTEIPLQSFFDPIKRIYFALSQQEVLSYLKTLAIVDRETEIIRFTETMLHFINNQEELTKRKLVNLITHLNALIDNVRNSKNLKDLSLLMADGIVRSHIYHTPAQDLDRTLEEKFGQRTVDLVIIGAGPAGLITAAFAVSLGLKVVVLDQGFSSQSFSDAFMQEVHWMTSDSNGSDLLRDSIPQLQEQVGLEHNLSTFRSRGSLARNQLEALTGRSFMGEPPFSDKIDSKEAVDAPNARNELYQHFMAVLDYVAQKGLVQEQSAVTNVQENENGRYLITTRDGYKFNTGRFVMALGMVGPNAEYSRQSEFLSHQVGKYLVLSNRTDLSNVEKREQLAEMAKFLRETGGLNSQLVLPDALLGAPEVVEILQNLKAPAGEKPTLGVIGDGESGAKSAVELFNINPDVQVDLFLKRPLFVDRDHPLPPEFYQGRHIRELVKNKEFGEKGKEQMKTQTKGTGITEQTYSDVLRLQEEGRLRIHVLDNHYFDETSVAVKQETGPDGKVLTRIYAKEGQELLAQLTGPIITAIGYNSRRATPDNPFLKMLAAQKIIPSDDKGNPVIATVASDDHLTIGYENKVNNPWFVGPGIGPQSFFDVRIEGMGARALVGIVAIRRILFANRVAAFKDMIPYRLAAFRLNGKTDHYTAEENTLQRMVFSIIHDKDFINIMGEAATPRMVYEPWTQPPHIDNKEQLKVPVYPEADPTRYLYIDRSLQKESNLELIPGLVTYLKDIKSFIGHFSDAKMAAKHVSQEFIDKVERLRAYYSEHQDLDISDIVAHPGRQRKVIYMDLEDYEALFQQKSTRQNTDVQTGLERFQMEPMMVQVLKHEKVHQILENIATEAQVNELAPIDQDVVDFMRGVHNDRAMGRSVLEKRKVGGIDFNIANINLQVHGQGVINFKLNFAMLKRLQHTSGFIPVIINIQPMKDLKSFLGV